MPADKTYQYDLFISYSSADRPWALKLFTALEAKNIKVFLSINKELEETKFRWEPLDPEFWTSIEAARRERDKLLSRLSVVVIDPISLYDNQVYNRLVLLSRCFNADLRKTFELPIGPAKSQEAKKVLQQLGYTERPPQVPPKIFLHYTNPADKGIAGSLDQELRKKYNVRGTQLVNRRTSGDVRYFYVEDRQQAETIRGLIERSLAGQGKKTELQLRFLGDSYTNVPRGQIEVWLPSLSPGAPQLEREPIYNPSIQRRPPVEQLQRLPAARPG